MIKSAAVLNWLQHRLVIRPNVDLATRSTAALYLMRLNPDDLAQRLQTAHVGGYPWSPMIRMMALRVLVAAGEVTERHAHRSDRQSRPADAVRRLHGVRPSRRFCGNSRCTPRLWKAISFWL